MVGYGAARLFALAQRTLRELEQSARVDLDKLGQALELVKMANLAARPRRRRRSCNDAAARSFKTLDEPALRRRGHRSRRNREHARMLGPYSAR